MYVLQFVCGTATSASQPGLLPGVCMYVCNLLGRIFSLLFYYFGLTSSKAFSDSIEVVVFFIYSLSLFFVLVWTCPAVQSQPQRGCQSVCGGEVSIFFFSPSYGRGRIAWR